jgi:hypothetical protein
VDSPLALTFVAPVAELTPASTPSVETSSAPQDEAQKQKQTDTGNYVFKEMPYTFVPPDDPIVERCKQVFFFQAPLEEDTPN